MEANVAYADSIYENLSERIKAAEDKVALGHIVGECSKRRTNWEPSSDSSQFYSYFGYVFQLLARHDVVQSYVATLPFIQE